MIDLRCGDAEDILGTLPDACCDALVSDPPAGISFMNLAFDGNRGGRDQWIAWLAGIMAEARRCLRPGGYALVWALPRTSHWTATALEDSGFRIIDIITHHFGQGFPKGKGQLKPASEHWILCRAPGPLQPLQIDAVRIGVDDGSRNRPPSKPTPMTYAQDAWTQNPANRAPFEARGGGRWPPNTLFSHVGGPDGCQPAGVRRVKGAGWRDTDVGDHSRAAVFDDQRSGLGASTSPHYADADGYESVDAWTCVDGCPVAELDRQAGPRTSGGRTSKAGSTRPGLRGNTIVRPADHVVAASTGSASRYFPTFPGADPEDAVPFRYQPKASRRDRNAGCEDLPASPERNYAGGPLNRPEHVCSDGAHRTGARVPRGNTHPTCKPTALMQWLCKLVTPKGGVVLDCFAGSGSTGVACVREGFGFIGIEQDATYVAIMRARIAHEQERADGQLALPPDHACG